jgi:hypothetical protein
MRFIVTSSLWDIKPVFILEDGGGDNYYTQSSGTTLLTIGQTSPIDTCVWTNLLCAFLWVYIGQGRNICGRR